MRKRLIAIILAATMALSLTACIDDTVEYEDTVTERAAMFEVHKIDPAYFIFVDKETGVCYLEDCYGITVMLNADGTPKIWEKY